MNKYIRNRLSRFFELREKEKELSKKVKKERDAISKYMREKNTRRLNLDDERHVTLIEPESFLWDIKALHTLLNKSKVRSRAVRKGFVESEEQLEEAVIVVSEAVVRPAVEEMLELGIITQKDVKKILSTRKLTSYIK